MGCRIEGGTGCRSARRDRLVVCAGMPGATEVGRWQQRVDQCPKFVMGYRFSDDLLANKPTIRLRKICESVGALCSAQSAG
jgi:hypothetical protein